MLLVVWLMPFEYLGPAELKIWTK